MFLLSEPNLEAAAKAAGVSPVTFWRWFKLPAFARAYREARREAVGRAIALLQQASGEAVGVLRQVMNDADVLPAARVTAARSVLEFSLKAVELEDLEARLADVERRLNLRKPA